MAITLGLLFAGDVLADTDALDELLENHHTETVTFVRDGAGIWLARINTDLGYCSAAHWREVPQETQDILDSEHYRVRTID